MYLNDWWKRRFESLDSTIAALEEGKDAWETAGTLAHEAAKALMENPVDASVAKDAVRWLVDAQGAAESKDLDVLKRSVYGARMQFNP